MIDKELYELVKKIVELKALKKKLKKSNKKLNTKKD